jgi:hypothetical protein
MVGGMRRTAVALSAVLVLVMSGCASAGGGRTAAEIDAAPATGDTISGTGYSYAVPEGWGVPEGGAASFGGDTLAADLEDADGFADNVNVILSPAGEVSADQVESAGADELKGSGGTDVQVLDRVSVAGSESAHLRASLSSSGVDYDIEQYYLTSDGQTYIVTFSFSSGLPDDQRVSTAESVLASWSWT